MLLQELKDRLRILDDVEDVMLQGIIEQGKLYFKDLLGIEVDFDIDISFKSLLLEYCRYVYNNATEYFEENFQKEILRAQLKVGVMENEKAKNEGTV